MRKWKRVDGADGARYRSALDAHESALLRSLVTSMVDMLDERETTSPTDELEELTGMKTGHSTAPEDDTMKRLLPDFYRPQTQHPAGSDRHRIRTLVDRLPDDHSAWLRLDPLTRREAQTALGILGTA